MPFRLAQIQALINNMPGGKCTEKSANKPDQVCLEPPNSEDDPLLKDWDCYHLLDLKKNLQLCLAKRSLWTSSRKRSTRSLVGICFAI